jgi:LacI family transcriptional regulator
MSIVKVAEVAGVSKSTVSRVINDAPGVTDEVRKAVRDAMEQIGYQPSARRPGRKPMSRKGFRTGNVLLLVLGYEANEVYRMPVFPSLLHGIETSLREVGMNLVLGGYQDSGPIPAALNSSQVDGVLIFGRSETINHKLQSSLAELPAVGMMRGFDDSVRIRDRVLYNNRAVGAMAAQYLLNREHRRAAFICLDDRHHAFQIRRDHFTSAMKESGGSVVDLTHRSRGADISPADYNDIMRPLVAKAVQGAGDRVEAFFVATDTYLPPFYQVLAELGVKPEKELDIISCDNEERFISAVHPRPATIDIHPELIGRHAVRQLIWRLGNMQEPGRLTLMVEPELVEAE